MAGGKCLFRLQLIVHHRRQELEAGTERYHRGMLLHGWLSFLFYKPRNGTTHNGWGWALSITNQENALWMWPKANLMEAILQLVTLAYIKLTKTNQYNLSIKLSGRKAHWWSLLEGNWTESIRIKIELLLAQWFHFMESTLWNIYLCAPGHVCKEVKCCTRAGKISQGPSQSGRPWE